ncbi:MAG: hypothetical protein GY859_42685 [Desulfobacterales bacterium]|nr:hypothetical protein [Desulfobacterales bacterium]
MAFTKFITDSGKKNLLFMCRLLFAAIVMFQFTACTTKIPKNQTIARDGHIFRKGEAEPFSGIVMGKTFSESGEALTYEKRYKNGILNGETKYYYDNGNLERMEPYTDGKINGIMTTYFKDGQPKSKAHLVDGQRGGSSGEIFYIHEGGGQKKLLNN